MAEKSRSMDRRQALRITAVAGVTTALGGGLVAGVLRRLGLHRVSETRTRMGTVVTITVVQPDADAGRRMLEASFDEMERLEGVLSRHRPDTPLSRLNRTGAIASAPPELIHVLQSAARYSELTDGAFDVTVAPLLKLYQDRFTTESTPPSDREVRETLRLVDFRGVHVRDHAIELAEERMSITLDGIAKGYIVDRTIDVLTSAGADRVLVNAGGDMASAGAGSVDDPWTVSIQDPDDERRFVDLVHLAGDCIATSGDYMRTFTQDRRFHHIIDPRTGYSPQHTSSVTVLARSAMDADALSTAGLVLGPVRGRDLLEGMDGVEAVLVTKDADRIRTDGMRRHVVAL